MSFPSPADLRRLLQPVPYPAVTVVCPTHRTAPENRGDPTRLKGLLAEARDRLAADTAVDKRSADALMQQLESLASAIDWPYTLDGVALCVADGVAERFDVSGPVVARVTVDPTFATRQLVRMVLRQWRTRVIVLAEDATRLLEGTGHDFHEVRGGRWPLRLTGPGGASKLPGGAGVNPSAVRDHHQAAFARAIVEALESRQHADPLPLILVGVADRRPALRAALPAGWSIIGEVDGSHATTPVGQLAPLLRPVVDAARARLVDEALQSLAEDTGHGRVAEGLTDCWTAAAQGRVRSLAVEAGYAPAARLGPDGTPQLVPSEARVGDASVIDDIVDDLIERVVATEGDIIVVPDGALSARGHVAARLRW
ncbi:MAG: hypothetical protein MUF53_00005 [Gemmatimonadaceae bacterium]|nr:hypothetical protein [Gemmatimonadaceae bacterium]